MTPSKSPAAVISVVRSTAALLLGQRNILRRRRQANRFTFASDICLVQAIRACGSQAATRGAPHGAAAIGPDGAVRRVVVGDALPSPVGAATAYRYDGRGLLGAATDLGSISTTFGYDATGPITSDARNSGGDTGFA